MILTYKYKLKLNKSAREQLEKYALAVNQVWNYCNAYQQFLEDKYKAGAKSRLWPGKFDFRAPLKASGKELKLPQQTVSEVADAWVVCRDRSKSSVKFRASFGSKRSLGWIPFQKQGRKIDGNSIIFVKRKYKFFGSKSRPIPQDVRGGRFNEDSSGNWYVSFFVNVEKQRPEAFGRIGIDLGLASFATMSDCSVIPAPQYYRKLEPKIKSAQRANRKKRTTKIHAKIRNCRTDFLHKLSTELAARHSLIAVGDVSSSRLSKVKKLAKSVMDAGWGTFRTMLKYKALEYIEVNEDFTTVTCSSCKERSGPKGIAGLQIRDWKCLACGANHIRDVNSALNILNLALSAQGLVEGSLPARGEIGTRVAS